MGKRKVKNGKIKGLSIVLGILVIIGFVGLVQIRNGEYRVMKIEMFPIEICNVGEEIYFLGKAFGANGENTYNVYKMNKENCSIEKIDIPGLKKEDLIRNIAARNGYIYLVVSKGEEENGCEVWEIKDEKGSAVIYNVLNIRDMAADGIRDFCIDKQGRFYFRYMEGTETIIFDPISKITFFVQDPNKNISFESMAVGENGNVFELFCRNLEAGGGYEIIEIKECQKKVVHCGSFMPYDDIYSVMGTGNEEFDIFIKGSRCIYGYNKDGQKVEYVNELSLDKYQYTKSCFLKGEQLLVFGMNPQNVGGKIVNRARILLVDLQKGSDTK